MSLSIDRSFAQHCLILAAAYCLSGWLGLQIPYYGQYITLVWLPTGIAVAGLMRWGERTWPGIYLGAFAVNLVIGSSWGLALVIAVGNTLGPWLTTFLLRKSGFHSTFDRQKDSALLMLAAASGMVLSASGGVLSLVVAQVLPSEVAVYAWLTWWMGDSVGVLLAAPLLLTLSRASLSNVSANRRELAFWLPVAVSMAWLAFFNDFQEMGRTLPLAFLTLPIMAWAALRFGITGAALASLGFSVAAAWSAATGRGTFYLPGSKVGLFLVWAYMAATVISGLLITALLAERRRAEDTLRESEEKLRSLFELSPLGIALTDLQGRYLEFNEAFRRITGYSTEELRELDYWTLTPKEYEVEEARQLANLTVHGRYGPYEKEYARSDGSRIPLRLNGVLVTGQDGSRRIWSLVEDISASKQQEAVLRQAMAAAEEANQAKSRFLATMSHEIRTPLNGVLGMAQLLLMPGLSEAERTSFARTIMDSGQTLLTLLNDVLDLSKIEAGRMEIQKSVVDPVRCLEDTAALFSELASAKGLQLAFAWEGAAGLRYWGDPVRLRQMLSNLANNAIKFTSRGFVRLEGKEVRDDGGRRCLEFAVADSGIGIPAEKHAQLFQPFFQIDASNTRQYGGSGLGLSIVRSLAELLGGSVGLESASGQGTRIWFRVPAELAEVVPEAPGTVTTANNPERVSQPSGLVLVVEDNRVNRNVMAVLLTKLGVRHQAAEDGQQALRLIEEGAVPDLILMDCHMPVLDGYAATERIRQWETATGRPRRPIVALTADAFEENRERCFAAGMDGFLAKPLRVDEVVAVLDQWQIGRQTP